jgi:Excalibur calcium-binding domain
VSKSTPKFLALLGAAALIVLAITAVPTSAFARRVDKDCANFPSQKAAQIFFIKHGGPRYDPDDLDGDDDGVACEDNPCPCYYKDRLPQRFEGRPDSSPFDTHFAKGIWIPTLGLRIAP